MRLARSVHHQSESQKKQKVARGISFCWTTPYRRIKHWHLQQYRFVDSIVLFLVSPFSTSECQPRGMEKSNMVARTVARAQSVRTWLIDVNPLPRTQLLKGRLDSCVGPQTIHAVNEDVTCDVT
jgi:hypothetical protein